jgi:regulator of sigma E protease
MLVTLSIFSTIGYILLFLLVLSVVICIHELGHFIFAKRAGILCHEFSFGMGPKIWSKKFGETEFAIRAIPFGGYVAMAGEEIEADVISVGKKIRLGFDETKEVNRIIVDAKNVNYHDFLEVTVEDYDLSSEPGNRLYINEYTVKRNAMYVFDKKHMQIAPKDRSFTYKSKGQRFLTAVGGPLMNFVLAFAVYLVVAFMIGVPNAASTKVSQVEQGTPAYGIIQDGDIIKSINGVDVTSWS